MRAFLRISTGVALALAFATGCSTSSQGATSEPPGAGACDPLAPLELPVTLGSVLGIGKDAQGTLYLADQTDGTPFVAGGFRVFVSSGGSLPGLAFTCIHS